MQAILAEQKILPAVTFPEHGEPLLVAEALLKGGLNILEVPFRTDHAMGAIKAIREQFPEMHIGAGTILTTDQLLQAIDAGASFGLSPALNPAVLEFSVKKNFPFIPGVMTPSEIEVAYNSGASIMKLFPAEQVGGIKFLQALQGPYDHLNMQFIPMGGVNLGNMRAYLELKNVIAIGGSWLAPVSLIKLRDYASIEKNTRDAVANAQKASD